MSRGTCCGNPRISTVARGNTHGSSAVIAADLRQKVIQCVHPCDFGSSDTVLQEAF